ncbi:putative bifunctional diguanylate cyclase/phosphodiesterase [Deinococcus sonorensis]|uniref:EAL domain-containing protein n=2 Tax=Deinococcus sonorensis TaxID=309891 RepID=A0AAU7U6G4_9DEIO
MAVDPGRERLRLHALRRYEVLDSLPEVEFDRITRLVATHLQTPVAFINFLDEQRGWFKAVHGMLTRQQDRHMSVCTHTIEQPDVLVVPDLTLDARFAHQTIIFDDLTVRSYIGVPLVSPDGHRIGTLSAVDRTPRSYTPQQRALLVDLAAVVIDELELRLAILKWREADRRSSHAAHHDALTGLANRALYLDHAELAIRHANRQGTHVAFLMMDLDRFKHVNDSLGHHVGDELLRVIAARCSNLVRGEATVARFGGDEFALLLTELHDPQDASLIATKVLAALQEPVELGGHTLNVSGSVGIAVYPRDGKDVPALLRAADIAMYHAKQQGGERACFHTEQLSVDAAEKLHRHQALERAVQREEFEVYYQPQVQLPAGNVVGVEALLRWPQPGGQVLLPGAFIPLAEQTRLIIPLGAWVLRQACLQLNRWRDRGRLDWTVAVNVSAQQWMAPGFLAQVDEALQTSELPPECLILELTESHLVGDPGTAQRVLAALRDRSVKVSLDDFGMGYSNLNQLVRLAFGQLKLDRSFVASIGSDERYAALVRHMIDLARELGASVVGEGVETQHERDLLTGWGCDFAQGFLFGRPVPAAQLDASL